MSRTERLLEVMIRIQNKRRFLVQELADEFHVSRRTMLRDLQALSELGVPLAASPGPHGGYWLVQDRQLPPLSFTSNEAISMILAYESFQQYADSPFGDNVSAITKLRNVLPPNVIETLDHVRNHVAIVGNERMYKAPCLQLLLQVALSGNHALITYQSRTGTSERIIYPFGLYALNGFWYCACFDYKRNKHVSLRADRVLAVNDILTDVEKPVDLTLKDWFERYSENEQSVEVRVRITEQGVKFCDWSMFTEKITPEPSGGGMLVTNVPKNELDLYAGLFIHMGSDVIVEAPDELIGKIRTRLQNILAQYAIMPPSENKCRYNNESVLNNSKNFGNG